MDCPPDKIINPATGKCVSRTSAIGKKLVGSPKTSKKKSVNKKIPSSFVSGRPVAYRAALSYLESKHKECFIIPSNNIPTESVEAREDYAKNFLIWEDYPTDDVIERDLKDGLTIYGNRLVNVQRKKNKRKLKLLLPDMGALYVYNNIKQKITHCLKNNTRFIIIPLNIHRVKLSTGHANMIIYDKTNNTAERYEPNGPQTDISNLEHEGKIIDSCIIEFLIDFGLIKSPSDYFAPIDMCPNWTDWKKGRLGHQRKQVSEEKGFKGSCATWTTWYTDYRLSHPELDRNEALKRSFDHLHKNSSSFTKFIKDYFAQIYEYSQK